ncbi:MAG: prepilin-type N-terminal cleavage/methylation domain-containing protein [Bacilli bacterium]|nr:prepilin-type N-terminal cleavage/methylation domain-containing protein [Bacilli bacterium]
MNKKGFTLLELLAAVIILGILALIIIPTVLKTTDQFKEEAYNAMIKNVENATRIYINRNKDDITNINVVDSDISITLQTVIDSGLLKAPIKDPIKNIDIDTSTIINVHVVNKNNYIIDFMYNK